MPPKVTIAGVPFDAVTFVAAVAELDRLIQSPESSLLVTPNPEMVVAAQTDDEFRSILSSAVLSIADGTGILWASYFLSLSRRNLFTLLMSLVRLLFRRPTLFSQLPERVTGTDIFPEILQLAAQHDQPVFLLGAAPGVAEQVADRFQKELPQLKVAGCYAGSPRAEEEEEIIQKINNSGAAVLIVAYGAPAQEKWLSRNLPKLPNIRLAAGLGGAFDFHAGRIRRAPALFRRLGLEWLWRLIRQPQRAGRIWTATGRFIGVIWKNR